METTALLIATAPVKVFYPIMLIAAIAALAATVIGFKKLVWFMSIGYGFGVLAIGAVLLVYSLFFAHGTIIADIMAIILIVYGFRLGWYLFVRETKNKNYKAVLDSQSGTSKAPFFVSVVMWFYCVAMYICQVSPLIYRLENVDYVDVVSIIGMLIMIVGVVGEALSDKQKSAAKAENPHRFCDRGLFKIVRCPNYFCEILVWTGLLISGIGHVQGKQWIVCIIGYVLIFFVMVSGAKRLEKRQEKNYGADPEYVKYSDTTPILFPLIPLYHLIKVEREK